jgi:hypothetical protein
LLDAKYVLEDETVVPPEVIAKFLAVVVARVAVASKIMERRQ